MANNYESMRDLWWQTHTYDRRGISTCLTIYCWDGYDTFNCRRLGQWRKVNVHKLITDVSAIRILKKNIIKQSFIIVEQIYCINPYVRKRRIKKIWSESSAKNMFEMSDLVLIRVLNVDLLKILEFTPQLCEYVLFTKPDVLLKYKADFTKIVHLIELWFLKHLARFQFCCVIIYFENKYI